MKEELYDILLDSPRVDLSNSKIMLESKKYFFSISLCFQATVKLLSIISIHIENKELDIGDMWKGYVLSTTVIPEEIKKDILFVGETYEAYKGHSEETNIDERDGISDKAYEVAQASYRIIDKITKILMGKNILL